jgi:hypothetical protein
MFNSGSHLFVCNTLNLIFFGVKFSKFLLFVLNIYEKIKLFKLKIFTELNLKFFTLFYFLSVWIFWVLDIVMVHDCVHQVV